MKQGLFFPRKQQAASEGKRSPAHHKRSRWLYILVFLLVLCLSIGGVLYWRMRATTSAGATAITLPLTRGDLNITIEGSGTVQPKKTLDLPFAITGQVREVLVEPGQQVTAGQPLARLDDRSLRFALQQAEADLQSAQAELVKAEQGAATPQDVAQAQARLNESLAGLEKARTGNVSPADLQAAEATLQAANARLGLLKDPDPGKVSNAQLAVTSAQSALDQARTDLSIAKTRAQRDLEQAASALVQAQSSYSTAYQNWQYVQDTGNDPLNPTTSGPNGKPVDNRLNDAQRQQYYDAYVKAQAEFRKAEQEVAKAQAAYESARQQEIIGIQTAEARLNDARNQQDALLNPRPTDLAAAQADVAAAQAQLAKLRQGGSRADRAAAQAQADAANAALEELTAPAALPDIAIAQARVAQAQAQVAAATLALANATLTAPFAGTVAGVSIVPGSMVGSANVAFTLIDLSSWQISAKLSENDIVQVQSGQAAQITFDTLPNQIFTGTVTLIATAATSQQGVVTYQVEIQFDPQSAPVKLGMTSNVNITVDRRENVLLAPTQAIQSDGATKMLQVVPDKEKPPITLRVTTGADNGLTTEIVSCVDTGAQCLREGDLVLFEPPMEATLAGGPGGGDVFLTGSFSPAPPGGAPNIQQIGP